MKLLNHELKSEYRNGSLDCLSDTTQERAVPAFLFTHGVLENKKQGLSRTDTCPIACRFLAIFQRFLLDHQLKEQFPMQQISR